MSPAFFLSLYSNQWRNIPARNNHADMELENLAQLQAKTSLTLATRAAKCTNWSAPSIATAHWSAVKSRDMNVRIALIAANRRCTLRPMLTSNTLWRRWRTLKVKKMWACWTNWTRCKSPRHQITLVFTRKCSNKMAHVAPCSVF